MEQHPFMNNILGTDECSKCAMPQEHSIHKSLGTEEGDLCNRGGCPGELEIKPPENCSCHIAPPCGACVNAPLHCPECHWEQSNEE